MLVETVGDLLRHRLAFGVRKRFALVGLDGRLAGLNREVIWMDRGLFHGSSFGGGSSTNSNIGSRSSLACLKTLAARCTSAPPLSTRFACQVLPTPVISTGVIAISFTSSQSGCAWTMASTPAVRSRTVIAVLD